MHERDLRAGRIEVLRDIMAAVARAYDKNALALPRLAILVLTGVQNFTAEITQACNIRKARNAADPGGHHDVARVHLPLGAIGPAQSDGPSLRVFVVAAALELGAGPIVQFHALYIGLEPSGEFVFGNVGWPVWRKRHVRQMVDVRLVVQDQRVIALAPVVADARFTVHDERVDIQLRKAGGDRKPGLPAPDDEHGRVALRVFGGGFAQVEPVRSAKIARVGLGLWPRSSEAFLVSVEFFERCQQRPCFESIAVVGIGREPQDAGAAALCRFKVEDRLDRIGAGAAHVAGRRPVRVEFEASWTGARGVRWKLAQDRIRPVDGLDLPRQGEHIAPMAASVKERLEAGATRHGERPFEPLPGRLP